jgi:hypothetical protein
LRSRAKGRSKWAGPRESVVLWAGENRPRDAQAQSVIATVTRLTAEPSILSEIEIASPEERHEPQSGENEAEEFEDDDEEEEERTPRKRGRPSNEDATPVRKMRTRGRKSAGTPRGRRPRLRGRVAKIYDGPHEGSLVAGSPATPGDEEEEEAQEEEEEMEEEVSSIAITAYKRMLLSSPRRREAVTGVIEEEGIPTIRRR